MNFNTEVTVDIEELGDFIYNELPGILLENTLDFGIAGFCLQAAIEAYRKAVEEK
jgi:hypothetical protein